MQHIPKFRSQRPGALKVFARYKLAEAGIAPGAPALLLEGSWPTALSEEPWALDDLIDARHRWIDEEASCLAGQLANQARRRRDDVPPSDAFLNELKLRYYFVKLLRIVVFFQEVQPLPRQIELILTRGRDEDYAALFGELCTNGSCKLHIQWDKSDRLDSPAPPPNARWRRFGAKLNHRTQPRWPDDGAPRVVLCGNRRILDAVCEEFVQREARVAWLYDRFAVRTWLRWRRAGVAQLVCNSLQNDGNLADSASLSAANDALPWHLSLTSCDVDLAPPVRIWLSEMNRREGMRQARLWSRIDEHFANLRPALLVLDEDVTPMARAAVAAARRRGVPSAVVQHGVPRVRFGFAPLTADRVCVWGESSRRQLMQWGVPKEQIYITGWTGGETSENLNIMRRTSIVQRRKTLPLQAEILLFATTSPKEHRPDAVEFHLTVKTHRQMIEMACAAVSKLSQARLTIKLHPRCPNAALFHAVALQYPRLRCRIVSSGKATQWLRQADCVLNCTSSAGVEASLHGLPVIELIPAGSNDLLPAANWGGFGTARSAKQLEHLLHLALDGRQRPSATNRGQVFAAIGKQAARNVADQLLAVPNLIEVDTSLDRLSAASAPRRVAKSTTDC